MSSVGLNCYYSLFPNLKPGTLVIHRDKTISIILKKKFMPLTQEIFQVDISFSRNRICEKYFDEDYWQNEVVEASWKK